MHREEGGCKRMGADADGCRRMGVDVMYQFESAITCLNHFFSVFSVIFIQCFQCSRR
jgi:hypothetical protein